MQGIAGIIYPDVFQINGLVDPMLETMRHRGEHITDLVTVKNVQIGGCGRPVAQNEKKTISAVVDADIYNAEELRDELKRNGQAIPHAATAAELVIHGYEIWGQGVMARLNGDFAVALYDHRQEKLILARDRIGKKPLYWSYDQNHFIFGSELKALLATGLIPQTPSGEALAFYLYFGYIPQDLTPIKNINKLLPGHMLIMSRERSLSIQSYWSYSSYFERKSNPHRVTVVKHLDDLLTKSVKARMPSSGTIGCFISGGLGSASIAYYLKKFSSEHPLTGFTTGFKGENDPDIKAASDIAAALSIPHEVDVITPENFLDNLVRIAWHLDEPLADANVVAIWQLAKISSKKTKYVYSGMGSDEMLAGHSRYSNVESHISLFDRFTQPPLAYMQRLLLPVVNFFSRGTAYSMLKQHRDNPWQFEYLSQNALFNEQLMAEASPHLSQLFDPDVFLHKFHNLSRIKSTVASFLYFDVKTRLADCFMLELERLTAAHGQNWSAPYLDRHLVEYLASLPEPDQLEEVETAHFLKLLLKNIYPSHIVNRPKRSRPGFLKTWTNSTETGELFKMLETGTLVESGLINAAWLHGAVSTPAKREASFRYLWALLMLEIWFRLFINRPIQTRPPDMSVRELLSES